MHKLKNPSTTINTNGFIARVGFWRGLSDPEAVKYAKQIAKAKPNDGCIFCPENLNNNATNSRIQRFGSNIAALPAYGHFAGYEVASHRLTIPDQHVEAIWDLSRDELARFIEQTANAQAQSQKLGRKTISFVRSPDSLAKSIPHVHNHELELTSGKVTNLDYSSQIEHGGVSNLEFTVSGFDEKNVDSFFCGKTTESMPIDEIGDGLFTISNLQNGWQHFDSHQVLDHQTIELTDAEMRFIDLSPDQVRTYFDYLHERNSEITKQMGEAKDRYTQDVSFTDFNQIGFRANLLTLGYDYISSFELDEDSQAIRFIRPSDEDIELINLRQRQRQQPSKTAA